MQFLGAIGHFLASVSFRQLPPASGLNRTRGGLGPKGSLRWWGNGGSESVGHMGLILDFSLLRRSRLSTSLLCFRCWYGVGRPRRGVDLLRPPVDISQKNAISMGGWPFFRFRQLPVSTVHVGTSARRGISDGGAIGGKRVGSRLSAFAAVSS